MSSTDVVVGSVGLPTNNIPPKKPSYLIILENVRGKTKNDENFIAVDKPELLNGFIQVKGFFCELSADEISKSFLTVLTDSNKELYVEMMFPWHRVKSVKSLIFKAK